MLTAIADAPGPTDSVEVLRPEWFAAFLADRGTHIDVGNDLEATIQLG
jgi:hypothetical protein